MEIKISWDQVNSLRLNRHHLISRASKRDLPRVISDVCGIQAQLTSAAELAIRARVEGLVQDDVGDAMWKSHSVVRTWCMRGTLHLLASSDLPLYVAALRSKLEDFERWLQERAGVSKNQVARVTEAISEALSGRSLTREELCREVERRRRLRARTRVHLRSPWGILLRPAAYVGHLAFGESVGQKAVFVDPSRWISGEEPRMEDAFLELFKRFTKAYGPVGVNDFSRWWGGLDGGIKSIVRRGSAELVDVDVGGFGGLMLRSDAEEAGGLEQARGVHLLPSFDCHTMFYTPRELLASEELRKMIFRKEAGWIYPSLVVDGKAAGIWGMKKRRADVEILVEPFRSLGQREKRGIREEGADIARFLGVAVDVRYQSLARV